MICRHSSINDYCFPQPIWVVYTENIQSILSLNVQCIYAVCNIIRNTLYIQTVQQWTSYIIQYIYKDTFWSTILYLSIKFAIARTPFSSSFIICLSSNKTLNIFLFNIHVHSHNKQLALNLCAFVYTVRIVMKIVKLGQVFLILYYFLLKTFWKCFPILE